MEIEVTHQPDEHLESLLLEGLRTFNSNHSSGKVEQLSVYARNEEQVLMGGLTAATFGKWLHIDVLWVDSAERKRGRGTQLLLAAEQEGIQRGCIGSTLDTYSFQALGFYLKQGYSQFGLLEGYAGKYQRHYLQKSLI